MTKDEKTEILKKYEELRDAVDLINENVPELQRLYAETGKLQKAFKKELEAGITRSEKNNKASEAARDAAEKAASYVKSQEKKLEECLSLLKAIQSEIGNLESRLSKLEEAKTFMPNPIPSAKPVPPAGQKPVTAKVNYPDLVSKDKHIILNANEFKSFRITFDSKDDAEPFLDDMKAPVNGWKWNKSNNYWYNFKTPENYDFAKSIIALHDKNQ